MKRISFIVFLSLFAFTTLTAQNYVPSAPNADTIVSTT